MSTAVAVTSTVRQTSGAVHYARVGQPRLRLTRRGRFVFTSLAALPVVAGVMVLALNGGVATATSGASDDRVTLSAGQSLWQLAEEIAPSKDPRDVISDFIAVNELDTVSVQAGQQLIVPAAYAVE